MAHGEAFELTVAELFGELVNECVLIYRGARSQEEGMWHFDMFGAHVKKVMSETFGARNVCEKEPLIHPESGFFLVLP